MSESEQDKELLFRYLQGEISQDEFAKLKQHNEESDTSQEHLDMVPSVLNASTCETDDMSMLATSASVDDVTLSLDQKATMAINYVAGKITFEEFDNFLENEEQEIETEEMDVTGIDISEEADLENLISSSVSQATEPGLQHKKVKRARARRLPKDLQGLMGEANLRFAHGEYNEAIKMCLEIIRLAPTAPEPFQTLGMLYEEMGQVEKSLQYGLIAAHLNPKDVDEWVRLTEMSVEQQNLKQAVSCLTKAIAHSENKVELMWERAKLYQQLGDDKKVAESFQHILQIIPKSEGEQYFQASRSFAEIYHKLGNTSLAIGQMEKAFEVYPSCVLSEYVNLLADLCMSQKKYDSVFEMLVKYCGVKFTFPDHLSTVEAITRLHSGDVTDEAFECMPPDGLPIDLRVKLIVTLIHMSKMGVVPKIAQVVYSENPEEYGDLFLDIAEAFMEKGHYNEAGPILEKLVESQKYNLAAVWLKYAECLSALGQLPKAADAYKQVVELVPAHYGARVSLSLIQQQLGQPNEALETLHHEEDTAVDYLVTDARLLLHRCHLLHSQGQLEEYFKCAKRLLFGHLEKIFADESHLQHIILCRTWKSRKEQFRHKYGDDFDKTPIYSEESPVSVEDLWELFIKVCQAVFKSGNYDELMDFCHHAFLIESFMRDPEKMKEVQLACFIGCLYSGTESAAVDICRALVQDNIESNGTWNLFNQAMTLCTDSRHIKFVTRLNATQTHSLPLKMAMGHCSLMTSSYKRSLSEYFAALRLNPEDPLINFCVGLSFIHLATQKYAAKPHSLLIQAVMFFNRYQNQRGDCQEVFYNLGRAMHQLGLLHAAVYYYQRCLTTKPAIKNDEIFDMKYDAAYNLSLIYQESEAMEMAQMVVQQYLVV